MYWEGDGQHQVAYENLLQSLVPSDGRAGTIQGELLRSAVRLASEYYRNGNVNWFHKPDSYLAFAGFIESTIGSLGPTATATTVTRYLAAVRAVGMGTADEEAFEYDPWDRLIHTVVEWCIEHPDPMPLPGFGARQK